jgi:hypothetical protein
VVTVSESQFGRSVWEAQHRLSILPHPEPLQKESAPQIFHEDVTTGHRHHHDTQHAAQPGGAESERCDRFAEEVSQSHPGASPEQHASDFIDRARPIAKMPARGGTTVVSPGTNFATSMAGAPS